MRFLPALVVLGTGLGEVGAGNLRTLADTYGFVLVATDWQGMSSADLLTIVGFSGELSGFRKLPERLHQGVLNQLVLGQLLAASDGLAGDAAFEFGGVSVIDPSHVYFYYGIGQGGILGGTAYEAMRAVPAVQQQIDRFLRPNGVVQNFCDGACDPG